MYYLKESNMIGFDFTALMKLFEKSQKDDIRKAIDTSGMTAEEVSLNPNKMMEIVDQAISKNLKNKDVAEIMLALLYAPHFYGTDSKILFVLNDSVDPRKVKIDSIEDLIGSIKEYDLTDFAIGTSEGVRQFQLKRIPFFPTIDSLFDFIKKKIEHYSNNLGSVNLLLALQSSGEISNDLFHELHEKLKTLNFSTEAHILISYNEDNKEYVMNQVYPEVITTRVVIKPLYDF